jgi:hypothetical protein
VQQADGPRVQTSALALHVVAAEPVLVPPVVDGLMSPASMRRQHENVQRPKIWGRGEETDVASWDPRVGKENRETAGANYVLG